MKVRTLIELLRECDPNAELTVSTPPMVEGKIVPGQRLTLPVLMVSRGRFPDDKPWVAIYGTDAWGLGDT